MKRLDITIFDIIWLAGIGSLLMGALIHSQDFAIIGIALTIIGLIATGIYRT